MEYRVWGKDTFAFNFPFSLSLQQVTFTNWFNNRLGGSKSTYAGPKVTDLSISLYDGILLIKLLENLTGKKIKGQVWGIETFFKL